jgi:hypothetical protein
MCQCSRMSLESAKTNRKVPLPGQGVPSLTQRQWLSCLVRKAWMATNGWSLSVQFRRVEAIGL